MAGVEVLARALDVTVYDQVRGFVAEAIEEVDQRVAGDGVIEGA